MSEWDEMDLTDADLALERELEELTPTVQRAALARGEAPDPAFLSSLRAQLVEPESLVPEASFERRLRDRLVGEKGRRPWTFGGAAALAAVAALIVLLVVRPSSTHTQVRPVAASVPRPSRADLTRTYPLTGIMGGGGGVVLPTTSRAAGIPGRGYSGRLRLTTDSLPATPASLSAYELGRHPFGGTSLTSLAHALGINAPSTCMLAFNPRPVHCGARSWTVVARNVFPSRQPLHSIAVSPTGEAIYHDLSYDQLRYRGPALTRARALRLARSWLGTRGWPASTAPVLGVETVRSTGPVNAGSPIQVSFGWSGAIRANVPAATVWVAPPGQVVEADVWPPVTRHREFDARRLDAAAADVEAGRAPIAVFGKVLYPVPPGKGRATGVEVMHVLVPSTNGHSYLDPVYRISGRVTLEGGQGTRTWYALVPALVWK